MKSQGERTASLDFVHCCLVGQQLLDRSGILRKYDLNYYSPLNESAFKQARMAQLNWAAFKVSEVGELVAEKLRHDPSSIERVDLVPTRSGGQTKLTFLPRSRWELVLTSTDGWAFDIQGRRSERPHWLHVMNRAHSDHVPGRLSKDSRRFMGEKLSSLLVGDGKQLRLSPPNTLFVVLWPAPLSWDDALADYRQDLRSVLEIITRAADAHRPRSAIGLWTEAFDRVSGKILLNEAGKALVGMPEIQDKRRTSA